MNNNDKISRMSKEDLSRRDFITLAALSTFLPACQALNNIRLVTVTPEQTSTTIPEPTDTPTPTDIPTPEPSPTPDTRAIIGRYFYPALMTATINRRVLKRSSDLEYRERVDSELNRERVNFVFLGRRDLLTDSIQIMSLDLKDNQIDTITMHRDTRAPEVTHFTGEVDRFYRINQAYSIGGIELTEKIVESATGLSSDYVVVSEMSVITRMVHDVFKNSIEVELPWAVPTNARFYHQGTQVINGEDALRLARERRYGGNRERNLVQQAILRGIYRRVKNEITQSPTNAAAFVAKSIIFFQRELSTGAMEANFDTKFFFDLAGEVAKVISQEGVGQPTHGYGFPEFGEGYHIKAERADRYRLKPLGGDPFAEDLLRDYWGSSRQETRDFLLK